jgi:hypothetical protein
MVSGVIRNIGYRYNESHEKDLRRTIEQIEHLLASGHDDIMELMTRSAMFYGNEYSPMDELFGLMNQDYDNPRVQAIARELYECIMRYYPDDKINMMDTNGHTLLMLAVQHHSPHELLENLIERGSALDLQDNEGLTALHHAVQTRHPETVRYLLEKGADPDLKDKAGGTPFFYADKDGKEMLKRYMTTNNNNNFKEGGRRRTRKVNARRIRRARKGKTHHRRRR